MTSKKTAVKWISHRGLCQHADENTLTAFTAAIEAGFDYLETDLQATQDGHIVLSHDQTLDRTGSSNITSTVNTAHSSRAALSKITLKKGAPLLFMDDFLRAFGNAGHVFDIKPESGFEVIELLAGSEYKDRINMEKTIFLLWSAAQQQALLKHFPQANCFARENQCRRAGFSILCKMPFLGGIRPATIYSVPPSFKGIPLFREKIINTYHQYDAKVLAYLPQSKAEAQMAINAGVSYVLSNEDFGFFG